MRVMTKPQLFVVGGIALVALFFILVFTGVIPGLQTNQPDTVKASLSMWGVGDSAAAYEAAFGEFKKSYPAVTVSYRSFENEEDYENALIEAFASGSAPDIFMIANRNFPQYANKIAPIPSERISMLEMQSLFPEVVRQDFVSKGRDGISYAFALPLSIDTLALVYNRDFFNASGIVTMPTTWETFKHIVPQLIKKDANKRITRAAAAIGGSETSIKNASDILSLLMLQSGTKMTNPEFTAATFGSDEGANALSFYIQFADPLNDVFTWNDAMPYSLDAFGQEKTAMAFAYAHDVAEIEKASPFLNFSIAPMPQPEGLVDIGKAVNYASYSGYAVPRQSVQKDLAQAFIVMMTTNREVARAYADMTKKPPALIALSGAFSDDIRLSVFARQTLTARSWPQINASMITSIFSEAIKDAVSKKTDAKSAVQQAETKVNGFFRK